MHILHKFVAHLIKGNRQISIISSIAKIFAKFTKNLLFTFLETNNTISISIWQSNANATKYILKSLADSKLYFTSLLKSI